MTSLACSYSIHVLNWKANIYIACQTLDLPYCTHYWFVCDKIRITFFSNDWCVWVTPPLLQCPDWPELMDEPWDVRINRKSLRHYKQSMELSGTSPSGGALPGVQDGGSIAFGAGSTFSESSIFSAHPSQLMWNLVTRGFEARMFLWSYEKKKKCLYSSHNKLDAFPSVETWTELFKNACFECNIFNKNPMNNPECSYPSHVYISHWRSLWSFYVYVNFGIIISI